MTTYIDRIVTEVTVEPETGEREEAQDTRWREAHRIEAAIKARARAARRTEAEGRDD